MRIKNENERSADQNPKTRTLKIYSKGRTGKYFDTKVVPEIRICGNWLQSLGFLRGRTVSITVAKEKLVIQLQPE